MDARRAGFGRRRRGFTLVEVMFASASAVVVMGSALASLVALSRLFQEGSLQFKVQSEARYGIERLASSISAAERLTVAANGDRIDLTVPATTLTAAVDASTTTLPVAWAGMLPHSGTIGIESEFVSFGGRTTSSLLSCVRGANGSLAAAHSNGELVYSMPIYYLSGTRLYCNMDGTPSTADDGVALSNVEKVPGTNLFTRYTVSGTYRTDRVLVALRCFMDTDNDHRRDQNEPGLDFDLELYPRNM